ncbi:hypothetical protein [Streptomyces himalayensis]|uniref:Uncharacterized protein n=1 Tax=Streptomyces himalayensis subsp. himalayensis TaxID=2756131 RepID=A0A7W0IAP5_9ACTN|nr:hypothetical protein [Streptomyces himalayensis]MBA2948319.1 hypothetical protein [Streptomyces himalayensis subsp. himalayensis]
MAETQQVDESSEKPGGATGDRRQAARAERKTAKLAKEIGAFAKAHGGAEGQIAYIGQKGARIVLVGEDGGWGDLVAPTYEIAERAVEKSGITRHEAFDGEFAAKVKTGPYEWARMAGIQLGGPSNG